MNRTAITTLTVKGADPAKEALSHYDSVWSFCFVLTNPLSAPYTMGSNRITSSTSMLRSTVLLKQRLSFSRHYNISLHLQKSLMFRLYPCASPEGKKNLNPLYSDIQVDDELEEKKKAPSWTVQDYDRHSLKILTILQFWMGDIYTPGYDTLIKKKEREKKRSKCCRIILLLVLAVCILIATITLSILLT
uniref:Major intrinsically disordered Notch2-binding receptor 1-like C-terminal domain-containing protein n=1 Tax=Melopsittacus undulatus TaxID=13146 RepID=A0A8C6JSU3_MELUD